MGSREIWMSVVVLEMRQFSLGVQYSKSGIYPKFSLLNPCYAGLIPYLPTFFVGCHLSLFTISDVILNALCNEANSSQ